MSDVLFSGGSRSSEPKRNGVKGPPDRRMENGVSSCMLLDYLKCVPQDVSHLQGFLLYLVWVGLLLIST